MNSYSDEFANQMDPQSLLNTVLKQGREIQELQHSVIELQRLSSVAEAGGELGETDFGSVLLSSEGVSTDADLVDINWWLPVTLFDDVVTEIYAMEYDGSEFLYVGGTFSRIGGVSANNIARYSLVTRQWSALGNGTDDTVWAIAISGSTIYVGGAFTSAGGVANTTGIAKWNGSAWSALGTGANIAGVRSFAISGSNLYAGGDFTLMGGVTNTKHIAKWDGSAWSALDTGVTIGVGVVVFGVAIDGTGNVFIGGEFASVGGVSNTAYIAKWDGSAWNSVGIFNSRVLCLHFDSTLEILYAGGRFSSITGVSGSAYIAKWDGSAWSALSNGLNTGVFVIRTDSDGNVYAGGDFTDVDENEFIDSVAVFDGFSWNPLTNAGGATGLNNVVYALYVKSNGSIYAGGSFDTAGSLKCQSVAIYCKTLSEATDTLANLFELYSSRSQVIKLGAPTTCVIASDTITITRSYHFVDTEGGAATDNLSTINGGETGNILILRTTNSARDVTLKDGTGNLLLAGDCVLDNIQDTVTLFCVGASWVELSRSNNA